MPDYKKKKHSRFSPQPKRAKKTREKSEEKPQEIKMSPEKPKRKASRKPDMKVVRGKKLANKKKLKVIAIALAIVVLVVTIFQLSLPAGIIDTLSNSFATIGGGSYPIELDGTETINCVSKGSYYYILSNTHIGAYTNSGKELFSYAHGFESPVLKASTSRAIVFNQGSTQVLIFDLKGLKESFDTKKDIITAGISDSGAYAIATHSDKYTAAVSVYNKRGKMLYEWYSAEDLVNGVAVSPNGKKIAVATFSTSVGKYKSKLSILNFKSPTAEHTESFDESLIYDLDTSHSSRVGVVTSNKISFIKWSNYKKTEYENEYNTAFFRAGKGGYIAVFNRENDKTDNHIAYFSKSGKLKAEIKYSGIISDIRASGSHIYCMSETEIALLNDEGEVLRKASCGFGAVRIAITSSNTVAVITDSEIDKAELERV